MLSIRLSKVTNALEQFPPNVIGLGGLQIQAVKPLPEVCRKTLEYIWTCPEN